MGRGLEVVTATATAAAAAGSAMAAAAGNSLTVRSAKEGSGVYLLQAWVDAQTAGFFRIRSPRLHDAVQGLRWTDTIGDTSPVMPWGVKQRLYSQDTLTLEIAGAAVVGDIETAAMLVYYEDLPGVDARLITAEEAMRRAVNIVTVENTLALGVAGGYSGEEALNVEFDLLHANIDYALLGYTVTAEAAVVRWRGPDTGNLGVGGPGNETDRALTAEWFLRLSRLYGLALVPVLNSANRAGMLVDGAQDENGVDTTVNLILAELGPAAAGR